MPPQIPPLNTPTRRHFLGAAAALGLSACGGGGDNSAPASSPSIQGLAAAPVAMGEGARITPLFSGGAGRIEPDIGTVHSGVAVSTPPLAGPRRYTLIVEATGQPTARRELDLVPQYRDRYLSIATPQPLQYHATVNAADGSVIVIGGSRGLPTMSEAVDRFDPATRQFTRIATMVAGRSGHTAHRLPDGRILVLGGQVSLASAGQAELIDTVRGTVTPAGRPALTRNRHAGVVLQDGRVLVVGGLWRNSVELWDPDSASFRLVTAPMRHSREFPSATLLADGRVLIVGGDHVEDINVTAEVFDPRTERFEPVRAPVDAPIRYFHEAFTLPDGKVLILGGERRDGMASRTPLASVLRFDPATQAVEEVGALDRPRSLVRSLLRPDGRVLMFGGDGVDDPCTATAGSYRDGTGQALAAMPTGRAWHTVNPLPDGRVLILGGDALDGAAAGGGLIYE
ncbi:MAG: hypothetical protein HY020_19450 [Burkholderiales bacterium]|nr:hypothetical protein [Burkholderiales bacterium]